MTKLWRAAVDWFENADLVPLLVLVSAVHYAAVLSGKDYWMVAVCIGLLVDLGHYRTVRSAVRYNGGWGNKLTRWAIALGMTVISLNYHQRYYEDWWLSAPLPLLIAALAWLQQVEPRKVEKPQVRIIAPDATHPAALPTHDAPARLPDATHDKIYACAVCGEMFGKSTDYASHKRWAHRKEPATL